jgi:transketolase
VLWDDNNITIDGTRRSVLHHRPARPLCRRRLGCVRLRRPRPRQHRRAPDRRQGQPRPALVACRRISRWALRRRTRQGPRRADRCKLIADTRAVYGWEHGPFVIPAEIKAAWEAIGARGAPRARPGRRGWPPSAASRPNSPHLRARPPKAARRHPQASRRSAGRAEEAGHPRGLRNGAQGRQPGHARDLGGSADLTGSNNTKTADLGVFTDRQPQGPLHPLRHPRTRHGRGDERHGAAWRHPALLAAPSWPSPTTPARDAAVGADGRAGRLCDDP